MFKKRAYDFNLHWLSFDAIRWLDENLTKKMDAFEYGSGGSTKYISRRVKTLVSVEDDQYWYDKVFREKENNCILLKKTPFNDYADAILMFDKEFDFILIDGEDRISCAINAKKKVKVGGYIMFDNSEDFEEIHDLFKGWEETVIFGLGVCLHIPIETTVWKNC